MASGVSCYAANHVAFVLPIFIVQYNDKLASFDISNRIFYLAK